MCPDCFKSKVPLWNSKTLQLRNWKQTIRLSHRKPSTNLVAMEQLYSLPLPRPHFFKTIRIYYGSSHFRIDFLTISQFWHSVGNIFLIYLLYWLKGWRKSRDNFIKYARCGPNRMLVAKWYLTLFARLAILEQMLEINLLFSRKGQIVLISLLIEKC